MKMMLPVEKNLDHFRARFQTKSSLYFHPTIIFISNIFSVFVYLGIRCFFVSFSDRIAQFTLRTWLPISLPQTFSSSTLTEHAHNLYRMSSNLKSIAYDLHYCPGSKIYWKTTGYFWKHCLLSTFFLRGGWTLANFTQILEWTE